MAKGKYQKWLSEEGLLLLQAWARDGLTDEQIAHNMGISRATYYVWLDKYPDISDAVKKGKEVVDIMVENSLLKRALGYDYTEMIIDKDGDKEHKRVVKKHKEADTTAIIFWLKNRRPDKWRDKREEVITSTISQQAIDEVEEFLNGLSEE